jgi:hypothetical protein
MKRLFERGYVRDVADVIPLRRIPLSVSLVKRLLRDVQIVVQLKDPVQAGTATSSVGEDYDLQSFVHC